MGTWTSSIVLVVALIVLAEALYPSDWGTCPHSPRPIPLDVWPADVKSLVESAISEADEGAAAWFRGQGSVGVSVGVVFNQTLIWSKGYGKTSLEQDGKVPNKDTTFRIGSISKVFAMLALMKMRDSGGLSLDDEVNKYIKDFKIAPPRGGTGRHSSRGITFRQLATHLSGMPRESPCDMNDCAISHSEALRRISTMEQISDANVLPVYSNLAFAVLGNSLAQMRGLRYEEMIQEDILKPMNMKDTGVDIRMADQNTLAKPYLEGQKACRTDCLNDFGWSNPAGSMYSSVSDLSKIISLMFREEGLISDGPSQIVDGTTLRETMLPVFMNSNGDDGFAITWELYRANGYTVQTKRGDVEGYASEIIMVPELKLGIVVLANTMEHAQSIAQAMSGVLIPAFHSAFNLNNRDAPQPPLPLATYLGVYSSARQYKSTALTDSISIRISGTGLRIVWDYLDAKEARLVYRPEASNHSRHIFTIEVFPGDQQSCIQVNTSNYHQKLVFIVGPGGVEGIKADFLYGMLYRRQHTLI